MTILYFFICSSACWAGDIVEAKGGGTCSDFEAEDGPEGCDSFRGRRRALLGRSVESSLGFCLFVGFRAFLALVASFEFGSTSSSDPTWPSDLASFDSFPSVSRQALVFLPLVLLLARLRLVFYKKVSLAFKTKHTLHTFIAVFGASMKLRSCGMARRLLHKAFEV